MHRDDLTGAAVPPAGAIEGDFEADQSAGGPRVGEGGGVRGESASSENDDGPIDLVAASSKVLHDDAVLDDDFDYDYEDEDVEEEEEEEEVAYIDDERAGLLEAFAEDDDEDDDDDDDDDVEEEDYEDEDDEDDEDDDVEELVVEDYDEDDDW